MSQHPLLWVASFLLECSNQSYCCPQLWRGTCDSEKLNELFEGTVWLRRGRSPGFQTSIPACSLFCFSWLLHLPCRRRFGKGRHTTWRVGSSLFLSSAHPGQPPMHPFCMVPYPLLADIAHSFWVLMNIHTCPLSLLSGRYPTFDCIAGISPQHPQRLPQGASRDPLFFSFIENISFKFENLLHTIHTIQMLLDRVSSMTALSWRTDLTPPEPGKLESFPT